MERQASLTVEIADQSKAFDPEAFEREMMRLKEELEAPSDSLSDLDFIDADFWARVDLDVNELLPPQWRELPGELGDLSGKVIPGDAVIARYSLKGTGPIDLQVIRGALFLTASAAYTINSKCFNSSEYQWKECIDRK